jgi:Glycosyltransferase family 87
VPVLARLRVLVWPLVLVTLATALYAGARRRRDFVDFLVYRTAAERAVRAEPLYRAGDGHYQFKYWPAFALAMAPVVPLDPEVARVVWYALLCGLLVVFITRSIRELPDRRLPERTLAWLAAVLLAKSIVQELVNGQTNLLLGVLLLSGFVAVRRGQPRAAGAFVGLGMFVKPYAVILLPWLAFVAGLPAIAAFAGVVAALLVLPAAVYGWHGNLDLLAAWYRTVTETTAPNLLLRENISLATMWAKWIGPGPAASTLAAASALTLLCLAATLWWKRRAVRAPAFLEVAFLLLLVPLLSPQGWDYVLLLAAPAFVCLIDRFREMSVPWQAVTAGGFALTSFTIFDILGRSLYVRMTEWSVVTVGAIALASSLAQLRWRALA